LPKADHDMKQVQAAAHYLTQAAEHRGPVLFSRIGALAGHLSSPAARVHSRSQGHLLGPRQAEEGRMTSVWIYEKNDTLHFFDSELEAPQAWLKQNDPQGVTTGHQPDELRPAGGADRYGVPKATERPHLRVVK
jgi:hypothetical protein